jgi:hypothetical protein
MKILVLLSMMTAAVCSGSNIIQNPGFESGTTGWTLINFAVGNGFAHSGTQSASTGCGNSSCVSTQGSGAYIQQTLSTTAGQSYDLSFWETEDGGSTSEMTVFWNGSLVADVLNPNNNGNAAWVQFTYSALLATSSSTVLEVHGRQDPAFMYFDDFFADVSGASSVPEPGTFEIAGLGALLVVLGRCIGSQRAKREKA